MITARIEDEADRWLREHDPYYLDKSKCKKNTISNPYETPKQEKRRREIEIPISNLNSSQLVQFSEVAGAYDENGNFEL